MNIQFKKDSLELLILLIIRKSDQYGYSLIQLIKKKVEISEGTIYPLLRKMVKEGYFGFCCKVKNHVIFILKNEK